jgi:hypothetical protein
MRYARTKLSASLFRTSDTSVQARYVSACTCGATTGMWRNENHPRG